jgi:hypothetical protein
VDAVAAGHQGAAAGSGHALGVVSIGLAHARRRAAAARRGSVPSSWRTPTRAAPLAFRSASTASTTICSPRNSAVVVELPFPEPERVDRNARAVLASTRHWGRMLNGYSGFTPASYVEHARALREFPDERAWALLRARGVTHLWCTSRPTTPPSLTACCATPPPPRRARPRLLLLRLTD